MAKDRNKRTFNVLDTKRSRLVFLVGVAIFGICLLTFFAVWNYFVADYIPMLIEFLLAAVLVVTIFIVPHPRTFNLAIFLGSAVIAIISWHNFATGGFETTGIMMVFLFPPIIFVLQGYRKGLWWSAVFTLICLAFYYFRPGETYFSIPYSDFFVGMFFLTFIVLTALIFFYQYTQEKTQKALERKSQHIKQANLSLEKEIVERKRNLKEAEEKKEEYEKINELMLGREIRIKQLKDEIEYLRKKTDAHKN